MDLKQECSDINYGGVEKIEYIPIEDIETMPDAIGSDNTIVSAVFLNPGARWYELVVTNESFDYSEEPSESEQGELITKSLKGFLPVDSAYVSNTLKQLRQRDLMLQITDSKGDRRLLGSLDFPYRLVSSFGIRDRLSGGKGYEIEFASSSPTPDYILDI